MYLKKISARYFRCITDLIVEFSPGLNIVIGANAQGKTSLLEGIYFLSLSRSLRTNNERELVQYGKDGFLLKGDIISHLHSDSQRVIETKWSKGSKKISVNGIELEKISELIGQLRIVFLTSNFSDLVREGASFRRKFLDIQISQMDRDYLRALQGYQRALKQRNELLRRKNLSSEELWVWEIQMAEHAKTLIHKRRNFVESITPFATSIHSQIMADEKLEIRYIPNVMEDDFISKLEENRTVDIQRGQTQNGPHRDDMEIKINGYSVRQFASQGQQKTCAYSIRISEACLYKEKGEELPVILADELFSDLDTERGKRFLEIIPDDVQVVITAVDEVVCRNLASKYNMFRIRKGNIEKA